MGWIVGLVGIGLVILLIRRDLAQRRTARESAAQPRNSQEPQAYVRPQVRYGNDEVDRANRPKGAERIVFHRSGFMPPEAEKVAVQEDATGKINLRLQQQGNRWCLVVPEGMVNFRSRNLYRFGIHVFNPRGTAYYKQAYDRLSVRPGQAIVLRPEPENEHDPNAVALHATKTRARFGYVNKLNAKRIAARLEAGEDLVAISLCTKTDPEAPRPFILVTDQARLDELSEDL